MDLNEFIKKRIYDYDPNIETRSGTAFGDLFIKPTQFIYQPFIDVFNQMITTQSLRRIQLLENPNDVPEEIVDDYGSNLFVPRRTGSKASVIARVYYSQPVTREFPAQTCVIRSSKGLAFINTKSFSITSSEMFLNKDGSLFYLDIDVTAEQEGEEYNVEAGELVSIDNDPDAVSVVNPTAAYAKGSNKETNIQYIERIKNSIGVRDLNTGKGINAILFEKFPLIEYIQPIGFKDPEMMRDIVYNAHVGGHTDIYLKTPDLKIVSEDVIGLVFDTTREIDIGIVKQIYNITYDDANADLGNPYIVSGSVKVSENDVALPATLDSKLGAFSGGSINLGESGNRYIKLQVDSNPPVNIKISGAISSNTKIDEIIAQINGTVGIPVAKKINSNQIRIKSNLVGANSQIKIFPPDNPRVDAKTFLFGDLNGTTKPAQFIGPGVYLGQSLNSKQLIFLKSGASGLDSCSAVPAVGDHFKIVGPGPNQDKMAVITAISVVTISSTNYYLITTDNTFSTEAGPTQTQFFYMPQTSFSGYQPIEPIEGIDFEVNYIDGKIKKIPSSTPTRILSGETIIGPRSDGQSTLATAFLEIPTAAPGFVGSRVSVGDDVFITGGSNTVVNGKTYKVVEVISDSKIKLNNQFKIDVQTYGAATSDISFYIVSNMSYKITYKYNPLSVDIGNLVELDDTGKTRGIRPGRENYTLKNMAFIDMISIEEIDPDTGEGLGIFLQEALGDYDSGFGRGGYGKGPFGIGNKSPFYYRILKPHHRFSAFEDSVILFNQELFGKSYRFTYFCAPEIVDITNFVRSNEERVLCADILPKNFIPAFVDVTLEYRIDSSSANIPTNEELTKLVRDAIESLPPGQPLQVSDIIQFFDIATYIKTPIKLKARVVKPNGTYEFMASTDSIIYPDVVVPKETDDPTTKRIVKFYPGNVTLLRL